MCYVFDSYFFLICKVSRSSFAELFLMLSLKIVLEFVFSCRRIFQSRKLYRTPTWQWEVDTGMAKSLEIPQTSTINAATHSTQNPLADRFSIYRHRPYCYLLNTEPRRGQFTIMTLRYCPAILDRRHNLTQKPLWTAIKIVVFPLPCGPLSELL